jgi:hypothetical protein
MRIKQRLLSEGFAVNLNTVDKVKEFSIILDSLDYEWWSGRSLTCYTPFGEEEGALVYLVEPRSDFKNVGYNNIEHCILYGITIYQYEEIFEDKFLYKEV